MRQRSSYPGKLSAILVVALLPVAFFAGCSSVDSLSAIYLVRAGQASTEGLAIAPVQFIADVLGERSPRSQYQTNVYVGLIFFRGGYDRAPAAEGAYIRNKTTEFSLQQEIRDDASSQLAGKLTRLSGRGMLPLPPNQRLALENFRSSRNFEPSPNEGRENINLPRRVFSAPEELRPEIRGYWRRNAPQASSVLFPIILQYYAHNAGWFNGQELGCLAGARVSTKFVVYDLETGKIVLDHDADDFALGGSSSLNPNERHRGLQALLEAQIQAQWDALGAGPDRR
ncbi:MAG: hypothetical protein K1X75_01070 [Leptospirales bacterium]|nr:hypothetical protein [Leptospirales bacterium]